MRMSDWSSDVCSSDLAGTERRVRGTPAGGGGGHGPSRWVRNASAWSRGLTTIESMLTWLGNEAAHRMHSPTSSAITIGRASGRERGWKYVSLWVVAVSLKKTNKKN